MIRLSILLFPILFNASLLADEKYRIRESEITDSDRQHWAFRPLMRPSIPATSSTVQINNPIDQFILARLEKANLRPLPTASRATLIRRLSFDLLGIPPTFEEVQHFVHDSSPDAYERLVDRMLSSQAYGERWAQHWLDLARFAETDGFEHDHIRKEAWRYRDWVIQAFNGDLPYDQFVRLQIAGDVIQPDSKGTHLATGFLMSGPDMPDINLVEERRHVLLNEMTSTVGSVFLGLTLECAQCHNHKYDPLSQADFYRFRAFFTSTLPDLKRFKQHPTTVQESNSKSIKSHFVIRGNFRRLGPTVNAAYLRVVNQKKSTTPPQRKSLAYWLTQSNHPLTARVMVNRLWMHHFGQGIVTTPSDFGILGGRPSHPELLDWLATEFVQSGWSIKRLHRLMVTSATYQRVSRPHQYESDWNKVKAHDAKNRLLARMNRRRLDGESIRDALLCSAELISSKSGGPGVRPPLPKELVETLLKNQWNVSPDKEDHHRRSVYVFARRNLCYPIFEAFDRPDGNATCAQRSQSTTAPQALILLNSQLSQQIAQRLANNILEETEDGERQIRACYQRLLSRDPTTMELKIGLEFLKVHQQRVETQQSKLTVLADYCLALMNLNEFTHVD